MFIVDGEITMGAMIKGEALWLRSQRGLDGKSQFAYSLDGHSFLDFGTTYALTWGFYRGDRIGVYCYNDLRDEGHIDIDSFTYHVACQ